MVLRRPAAAGGGHVGRQRLAHPYASVRDADPARLGRSHAAGGLLGHLDGLGLLSERLTVAHGVWLREPEMELLAQRGATVVVNAVSNLRLRSGRAPVAAFMRNGLKFALGLDCFSMDDDTDGLRDLRIAYLLNAHAMIETPLDPPLLFEAALARGYFTATGEQDYGALEPGAPADLFTIDMEALAADRLEGTVAEEDLFLTRAQRPARSRPRGPAAARWCATARSSRSISMP